MYLSRLTGYQDPISWKHSSHTHLWACHPLQAPHVCVIPWVSSELIQGLLNFWWLQMSLRSLCLLSMRSLMLRILPCIPQTSLHPRHHSSWTGTLLPFLLGYLFIPGRFYINDLAQQCYITALCLRPLYFFESIIILLFILYYFSNCRHLFFGTSLILIFL